jgi:hypothetical protein
MFKEIFQVFIDINFDRELLNVSYRNVIFWLPGAVYESEEELESESEEENEGKNFLKACDRMFL